MKLSRKILMIGVILYSLTSYGEQWDSVVMNDNSTVFLYDPTSVKRNGDTVQYWELTNYKEKLKSGNIVVGSSKSLIEVDCKKSRYRNLQVMDFEKEYGLGTLVNVDISGMTQWYPSEKGSVSSAMEDKICSIGGEK